MTLAVLLPVAAFIILLWPELFIFRGAGFRQGTDVDPEAMEVKAFLSFDLLWIIFGIVILMILPRIAKAVNISQPIEPRNVSAEVVSAFMTLFIVYFIVPIPVFAGITGIYPQRTRGGCRYYVETVYHQHGMATVQFIGWLQTLALLEVAIIALLILINS